MEIREYTHYNEAEVLSLYTCAGWTAYTDHPQTLRRGFANSLLILGAYEGDTLLGLVRVVGDGETIVFVQDLLVRPEHQRKGIGSALLKEVLARYAHVRQLQLTTDNTEKTNAFYRALGFRDLSGIGCRGFMRMGQGRQ